MNGVILGIDGSLGDLGAAVVDSGGAVLGFAAAGAMQALEDGLGAVATALGGRSIRDLDAIAVCTGPGSYTGSRIAVSYAKALAQAGKVPLVAISSYDVLTPDEPARPLLAVVPGRTGLVCARLLEAGGERSRCGTYDEVADWLIGEQFGDLAATAVREDDLEALAKRGCHVRSIPMTEPAAVRVARLAFRRSPEREPLAVVADYGFPPVAAVS